MITIDNTINMEITYQKVIIEVDDVEEYNQLPEHIKARLKIIHNHNTAIDNNINKLKVELKQSS